MDEWQVNQVVEIAPNLWARLTSVDRTDLGEPWTYIPVAPRWSMWQRVKLWFGWRPTVGY